MVLGVVVVSGMSIDLSWLRGRIETVASDSLDRRITLEGPISLLPTLRPTVQVENVHVGNPEGWPDGDLAQLELARAGLAILPLFSGEVRIDEITVQGLRVSLEVDTDGNPNWLLPSSPKEPEPVEDAPPPALDFVELGELSVRDIIVTHRDATTNSEIEIKLNEVTGSAKDGEPLQLFVQGAVQSAVQTAGRREHYALTLTGGTLAELLGGEPWPVDLSIAFLDVNFSASGEIEEPLRFRGANLDFHLQGPMMKDLEVLVGATLPPIRSMNLRGRIIEKAGAYGLADLEGQLGNTKFTAALEADLSKSPPRFVGNIDVPSIDIGPFYAAIENAEDEGAGQDDAKAATDEGQQSDPATTSDETFDLDAPVLTLEALRRFDADFNLTVGEVENASTSLRNASLQINVEDGKLVAPMAVTYAEVPFNGKLSLHRENDQPAADIVLWADRSDIGELAKWLTRAEGVEGTFDRVELGLTAQGESARAVIESAELKFSIAGAALSYGHNTDGDPVEFTLEKADAYVPAKDETRVSAQGTLLREPFSVDISGGTFLENLVGRNWPLDLQATGGGAELRVSGSVAGRRFGTGADLDFELAGEHIGDLGRWLALSPQAQTPHKLRGKFTVTEDKLTTRIDEGRIGKTTFEGELGIRGEETRPITFAALQFETLDLDEIADLVADDVQPTPSEDENPFKIDVPIMPTGIELFDSDVDLSVEQVVGVPAEISAVELSSRIRGGHVVNAPFKATVARSAFAGDFSADLRGEAPLIDFQLEAPKVDIGRMLAQLGVIRGLEMKSGRFDLELALRGVSPREILQQSTFSANIHNGVWRIRDPKLEGSLDIGFPRATLSAEPDKPITLALNGRIDKSPVKITVSTDPLASFADPKDRLRMDVAAALAGANIKLSGRAPLPVRATNLHFKMDLRGKQLSEFDELLRVSLPPWGPYELSGDFGTRKSGYYVENLVTKIGESTLEGKAAFETTQSPPRLNVELDAKTIQLDDFDTRGWSAISDEETAEQEDKEQEESALRDRDLEQVRAILSPEVMRTLDGQVDVEVREVLSGKDRLGDGKLTATLENGKFKVDPLALNLPGGSADVAFAIEPTENDVAVEARAKVEQLDYGILARRIEPESDVGGIISVDVDLVTRGPDLENAMYHSNGEVDFAIWPEDLDAGIFDLWAVNLLMAVLPSLDSENTSKINCVVGRFEVEDGIMRPTALLIDSSRIQASGDGVIDFKEGTIDFVAAPKPKRPQFFSAQTPIAVQGRLADFEVALPPGAEAETVVRILASPITVPFEWIFTKREPADGEVACKQAWGREPPE
jgi:hypothetical protein